MRLLCPAKINLHLRVGPVREDGFHPLLSWFCTIGLFDTLTLSTIAGPPPADDPFIALTCDNPDLPVDGRNLVVRVGKAWGQAARSIPGARVEAVTAHLQKRIPAGAGLGGGSSDGARVLLGLNALWNTGRAADYLLEFAAPFGSDLPFFFFGPSSACRGRGEIVQPIPPPMPRWALLVMPPIALPTPAVYRQFDAMRLGNPANLENEPDWKTWTSLDAQTLLTRLGNDLEPSAFAMSPALGSLRDELIIALGRPVRMSGSGSSLFTLYDSVDEANHAKQGLGRLAAGRIEVVELAPSFSDALNRTSGGG